MRFGELRILISHNLRLPAADAAYMDPWTFIRQSGAGGFFAVAFAIMGALLGIVALILLLVRVRNAAYWMGAMAIVFAIFTVSAGLLGVALGKQQTDNALRDSTLLRIQNEEIRREGYRAAQTAAVLGYSLAPFPLCLGAIAALLAARKKQEQMRNWKPMAAGSGMAVTLLLALVAHAESRSPLPGHNLPFGDPGWRLLRAEELLITDFDRACIELEETLEDAYWPPTRKARVDENGHIVDEPKGNRADFPRTFAPDPRIVLPDFEAFADRCVLRSLRGAEDRESAFFRRRSPEDLVESPLLLDPKIFNKEERRDFDQARALRRQESEEDETEDPR